MNRVPRTHLLVRGKRVACRISHYSRFSKNPAMVTCSDCRRSPHMADAEQASNINPNNRT